jgi:predicted acylesterase/phospholipase RssA
MTTAFVLSGGGSLGAVQVGMLQALADHHIAPDLLVGAPAGALNAVPGGDDRPPRPLRRRSGQQHSEPLVADLSPGRPRLSVGLLA